MRIVVTGAAGFIGSQLCEALLQEAGTELLAIDNFDPFYDRSIKEANIRTSLDLGAAFEEGDIRDRQWMIDRFEKFRPDLIYHLAAKAGVRPSLDNPEEYVDVNVDGTVSVLEATRKSGAQKLILSSSSSIYGKNAKVPFEEPDPLENTVSVYGASKRSAEVFLRMYHNLYGLDCMALRLFTVYGPRQRPDLAIHKFTRAILKGEPITIYGDGSMARDYTYVGDVVQGMLKAKERLVSHPAPAYELYNLGNTHPVTLNELVGVIEEASGKQASVTYEHVPKGDVPMTYADVSKAKDELGYLPETELQEGVAEFLSWLRMRDRP